MGFCFWLAAPAAFALSGNIIATDNVKAHLVSEVTSIAPGESFWVALELIPARPRRSNGTCRPDLRRATSSGPCRTASKYRPW